ncbi:MAG: hypothetical protein CM1200mP39_26460 [Dehalococcoidia bacterium]|nr:MAG: hypothetical protein CM1200mP39_26460 [Dehalococcoidia bacterium]
MGYEEAWIGEHFTAEWEPIPSPELFIAQALGGTKNIRLGTGVTCMPNHDPFVLAQESLSLIIWRKGDLIGVLEPGVFQVNSCFWYDEDGGWMRGVTAKHFKHMKIWESPEPGFTSRNGGSLEFPNPTM